MGLLLVNRYSLDEPVGQGALCTIYRGSDTVLRRSVAVKAVAPDIVGRYREALKATAGLTHPAAVATYDALEHDGWLFLVQEYVTGRPLSAYLRDGLPAERAVDLACQVARAIAYAHLHGIIHGDLTPAAVLVDRHAVARVNNFALPPDTAYFERCRGEWSAATSGALPQPTAGAGGDVRAVGYLLWHLLSEPRPEKSGSGVAHRAFRPDVPADVREGVRRCIAGAGDDAIADAETLVSALEALAEELAKARTLARENTPPALRAAREIVAREAAWSAEETLGGVRYWGEAEGADAYRQSAPTDPMSREARPRRDMSPAAELTPRLRLPSRPVDDAISSVLRDFAAGTTSSPSAAEAVAPPSAQGGAASPAVHGGVERSGWELNLALVVGLGIAFFLLFFILGYLTPHLFGIS